jgi:hypothetical protein
MEKVRTSLRPGVKVIAVITGPLFVGGLLAVACVLAFFAKGSDWYRYPLVAFMAGGALFCAWRMLETFTWLELDGDVVRAKNFWTRRVTERRIEDVLGFTPPGRGAAWIVRFRSGGRLALVRLDMVEPDAFIEAVTERAGVFIEERDGPVPLPERAEATFRYTSEFARSSARRYFMKSNGWRELLAICICVGGYFALRALGVAFPGIALVFGAVGLGLDALRWYFLRRGALSFAASLADPTVRFRFEDDALVSVTEKGELRIEWKAVSRVWRDADMWILALHGRNYVAAPSDALSAEQGDYIIARVERASGKFAKEHR